MIDFELWLSVMDVGQEVNIDRTPIVYDTSCHFDDAYSYECQDCTLLKHTSSNIELI